ncbi:acyl-CoA desaturase [Alteromonas genovensis]|uniref:Acyl-CoA desaturase n=1 Tax=Alteromonas genovensis TaxID=471225 RepID=A0A6N9TBX1_9ALTE|nr:acyl-CoA desaturase [Alteromonas genovensis]NDW14783.1 acyl-CoA desaturase [Alteromonas genovensis]
MITTINTDTVKTSTVNKSIVNKGQVFKGSNNHLNSGENANEQASQRASISTESSNTKVPNYSKLATQLDAVKTDIKSKIGSEDAAYIRRVILAQRACEWTGRILLMLGFIQPLLWVVGVLSLATAKILDNMEIGHNVMHGQYDWMNDKHINSKAYEWDIACDGSSWNRVHNYEHHTYTNIIGKDRDFGYGLLRLSNDFRWRVKNLWQFITYVMLSVMFQWGVSYHEMAAERVFFGKKKDNRKNQLSHAELKRRFFSKGARQLVKDYVLFPLLAGPFFLYVFTGNLVANLLRNLWTSTIIFCGHFTGDVQTFSAEDCVDETQGQWYYRQGLGSSNIKGGKLFHVLTGHLSFQIEHHLFPDIPARRYKEMAPQVQAIFKEHGMHYNTGGFFKQYASVLKRIVRYSFP